MRFGGVVEFGVGERGLRIDEGMMNVTGGRNQDALRSAAQRINANANLVQSAGEKTLEGAVFALDEGRKKTRTAGVNKMRVPRRHLL